MNTNAGIKSIFDDALLHRLSELVRQSRRVESELVAHIGEVERRGLHAREGTPSMFAYCTEVLHLSEHEAYLRIAAARAARKHPVLLEMLRDGRLHLSAIEKLAPHLDALDDAGRRAVLARATHQSKRKIVELVAALAPQPDVPPTIRKLPTPTGAPRRGNQGDLGPDPVEPPRDVRPDNGKLGPDRVEQARDLQTNRGEFRPDPVGVARDMQATRAGEVAGAAAPTARPAQAMATAHEAHERARASSVQPLAPARYKVTFTAGAELREKLERLQALLPSHDLEAVIEAAVTEKLERVEARRFGRTRAPRKSVDTSEVSSGSRYIPAAVRRVVYERDGGRCTFVGAGGRRCGARRSLELHHDEPFALGGDRSPENIRLLCRTHNGYLAEATYGTAATARGCRSQVPPQGVVPPG